MCRRRGPVHRSTLGQWRAARGFIGQVRFCPMSFLSALRVALDALLVNKGRSVLTSLGIVIGIGSVIAMVSAGGGAREKLDERLESVGKNLILVQAGARSQQGFIADFVPLTREDAEAIRKEVGPLITGAAPLQQTRKLAMSRTAKWPV